MDLGKKIEATRQLGSEFLTWMLFRSVLQEGIFETEAGQVELWFEDKITLVSPFAGGEINILKGEAPAESRESLTALLKANKLNKPNCPSRSKNDDGILPSTAPNSCFLG